MPVVHVPPSPDTSSSTVSGRASVAKSRSSGEVTGSPTEDTDVDTTVQPRGRPVVARQAAGRPAARYECRPTLTIDGMARPRRPRVRRVDETSAGGLVVDTSSGRTVAALIGRKDRRG